jgi:hypothetical protein
MPILQLVGGQNSVVVDNVLHAGASLFLAPHSRWSWEPRMPPKNTSTAPSHVANCAHGQGVHYIELCKQARSSERAAPQSRPNDYRWCRPPEYWSDIC